jgi:hypothetical protein
MPLPHLTFFCELEVDDLQALFANPRLIAGLNSLKAGVSLGLLDLSPGRVEVVRQLNRAGIPVTAWLLLRKDQGYWFNQDNAVQAVECYIAFDAWTRQNGLEWAAIGLDIEPDLQLLEQLASQPQSVLPRLVRRAVNGGRLARAQAAYAELAKKIRADGYFLESYQLPFIADERKIRSSLLRRLTGLVDLRVDREVWMLYSSFARPLGVGYLWSYAPEAQAIGVGSTGGGVGIGIGDPRPLTWEEFARDLRLAWFWTDHLYIFSLEGCVRQGFMEQLKEFRWDTPIFFPEDQAEAVARWRGALQGSLWLSRYLGTILAGTAVSLWVARLIRNWLHRRRGYSR